MDLISAAAINTALTRVGAQLAFENEGIAIVIVGGAALNLLGIVARPTIDVDILAFAALGPSADPRALREPPKPIPPVLENAIAIVARDMALDPRWMNTGPALQWEQGLPPGLAARVTWRHYGPSDAPGVVSGPCPTPTPP